jgi:hypothetical protein
MTTHRDAARARWRADLREFTGIALRSAGLDAMADQAEAEIRDERAYADLIDELAAAKDAHADAGTDATRDALQEVKVRVADFRRSRREGGTPTPGIVNNFAEPSDAELIELGY